MGVGGGVAGKLVGKLVGLWLGGWVWPVPCISDEPLSSFLVKLMAFSIIGLAGSPKKRRRVTFNIV